MCEGGVERGRPHTPPLPDFLHHVKLETVEIWDIPSGEIWYITSWDMTCGVWRESRDIHVGRLDFSRGRTYIVFSSKSE